VRSLYGRYAGSEVLENCWAGHVEGDIHDRAEDLVARLMACPLIADEAIWKQVDHAIVAVSGTRHLGLSDVQEMVTAFKDKMPIDIPIATSASLDEQSHDKVRMTVLLATTAPARLSAPEIVAAAEQAVSNKKPRPVADTKPLPKLKSKPQPALEPEIEAEPELQPEAPAEPLPPVAPVFKVPRKKAPPKPTAPPVPVAQVPATIESHPVSDEELLPPSAVELEPPVTASAPGAVPPVKATRRHLARQEEMSFEAPPRGRFEKTHETMYRGENLDQPTFRRRGLKIRV
jgi:hypothetical protein